MVTRRSGWSVVVTLAAALALAGCSAAATPAPSGPQAMPAGTYSSKAFQPTVTYNVPAGWVVDSDAPDYYALRPAVSDIVGIYLFRGAQAASQDKSCPESPEPGVDNSAAGIAAWIRGLKGLKVSSPRLATVGGLRGTELDLEIAQGWKDSCSYANGLPTVQLLIGRDATYRWTVAGNEKLRLTILDAPDKSSLIIDVDAFDGALFDDIVANAAPIIKTFSFKGS